MDYSIKKNRDKLISDLLYSAKKNNIDLIKHYCNLTINFDFNIWYLLEDNIITKLRIRYLSNNKKIKELYVYDI